MKSLVQQLKTAPQKSVIIVGDIMVDEYIFGTVSRISPEAPVPVVREQRRELYLGGAANVAANCVALGLDTSLIGIVNNDDVYGRGLTSLLKKSELSAEGIVYSGSRKTSSKNRVLAQNHHCLRIDNEDTQPLTSVEFAAVAAQLERLVKPNSIILVSDYAKGVVTPALLEFVKKIAQKNNAVAIADPKGPSFDKYKGMDYLKPNMYEFKQLTQALAIDTSASLVEQGRTLCAKLELQGIIVTLGEHGMHFISPTEDIFSPAFKREVYDLSGAGDTVFAYLAVALAHRVPMVDALKLANKAASIAISHLKTYAVRLEELLDDSNDPDSKIVFDWLKLKQKVETLRMEGRQIVFTNGCFDLLHPGHIKCLHEAKKQGDILVVALNSDDSVRRLNKGPERPLNSLDDRAMIIAGLESVDIVASFDQDTPQEIINLLQPDILVKGGDYRAEEVVGYKEVVSRGGVVSIIPLVEGKSTTSLVKKA
ncbi:D-glycero-beta-D-manno-heptose 1-phosphate adenylyltransferase, partial [Candidatus Dependentiae bacterium]|nr:D-glycero-beta-D-manno-heptose 1-phosphate adenylyltransferase [Candidatus Dependentiae bacterium]